MLFFLRTDLTYGSYIKLLKKYTKKNQNAIMLYGIERQFQHLFYHFILLQLLTGSGIWFPVLVQPCPD